MRKSNLYSLAGITLFIIVSVISLSITVNTGAIYDEFCKDNGYNDRSINPQTETSTIDLDDKLFINCQQKVIIDGKLQIINEWLEIDYKPADISITMLPMLVVGISAVLFTIYALNKDEWN